MASLAKLFHSSRDETNNVKVSSTRCVSVDSEVTSKTFPDSGVPGVGVLECDVRHVHGLTCGALVDAVGGDFPGIDGQCLKGVDGVGSFPIVSCR